MRLTIEGASQRIRLRVALFAVFLSYSAGLPFEWHDRVSDGRMLSRAGYRHMQEGHRWKDAQSRSRPY